MLVSCKTFNLANQLRVARWFGHAIHNTFNDRRRQTVDVHRVGKASQAAPMFAQDLITHLEVGIMSSLEVKEIRVHPPCSKMFFINLKQTFLPAL